MKRWAIVDIESLEILSEYRFVSSQLGKGAFGGRWNDPSQVLHLPIPQSLDGIALGDLRCVYEDPGQLRDDCGCLEYDYVPGDVIDAFREDGTPIKGSDGKQLKVQSYVSTPKLGKVHYIARR